MNGLKILKKGENNMALKAGRRGLHKRLVDAFGNLNSGTPSGDYYTKQQTDDKFELKTHIGGLQFRDNEGQAQYKLPNGEWVNFSSGGAYESLWQDNTPPDPNVFFNAQTISVDLSNYEEVVIKTRCSQYSSFSNIYEYALFKLDDTDSKREQYVYAGMSNSVYHRKITITNSGIEFQDCRYNGQTSGTGYNNNCIPIEILAR